MNDINYKTAPWDREEVFGDKIPTNTDYRWAEDPTGMGWVFVNVYFQAVNFISPMFVPYYWTKGLMFHLGLLTPEVDLGDPDACPWCSAPFELTPEAKFEPTKTGSSFNGETTDYWAEGVCTCKSCRHTWEQHFCS